MTEKDHSFEELVAYASDELTGSEAERVEARLRATSGAGAITRLRRLFELLRTDDSAAPPAAVRRGATAAFGAAGRQPRPWLEGIKRLVARLSHNSFRTRKEATHLLIALGPAVRRYLKSALRSRELEVLTRVQTAATEVMAPIPRTRMPDPKTRVVVPAGVRPAPSLEEALKLGRPIVVFSGPPCEFDCARILSAGPLADPRVAEMAERFTWIAVQEYGKAAEAARKRLKTERSVFLGILDKDGAPVGAILDVEATADQLIKAMKRAGR